MILEVFNILLIQFIVYGIPLLLLIFMIYSITKYRKLKKESQQENANAKTREMKKRLVAAIISAILFVLVVTTYVAIFISLAKALENM